MLDKQKILRDAVRAERGLTENDMLLMTLSSINPGKGQLILLEFARSVIENSSLQPDSMSKGSGGLGLNRTNSTDRYLSSTLFQGQENDLSSGLRHRKILFSNSTKGEQTLKVLIGSVGSKNNKIPHVRETLLFLSQHPLLSQSVSWTPTTTRVSSLYSAADVYIINSQGMGVTFGRVTIEAMAFRLPVLGTDLGGRKEIVENNETGLLHSVGHSGNEVLTQNIRLLLENPSMRQVMGIKGRKKVEKIYLKRHMYKQFAAVLSQCTS